MAPIATSSSPSSSAPGALPSPQTTVAAMIQRLQALQSHLQPDAASTPLPPARYQDLLALQRDLDALFAAVAPPQELTISLTGGALETKALLAAADLQVAHALANDVLTVDQLAERVGADSRKLGQVMRMLANRFIFTEVGGKGSGKFANNRVSATLDSTSSDSLVPFVGQWGNDTYDAARQLTNSLWAANSNKAAFQLTDAAGVEGKNFFQYVHEPAQADIAKRINASQTAFNRFVATGIKTDFDWNALEDTRLIDVGGSIGPLEMELLPAFPRLRFEIQDLKDVVEEGQKRWESEPDLAPYVSSRQVTFAAHDFFQPQPKRADASTAGREAFLIKQCLHNWTDEDAVKILSLLRRAALEAQPSSPLKLYAIEFVLSPESGRVAHMIDINIQALVNSIQRTEQGFRELFEKAGWTLERTHQTSSYIAVMVASPHEP